ncbi:hypothetical protein F5883DRAFT_425956 [Diaporthe sp. PMI_573]|nr:hypothetical protein F5883DRAFT_425956 [Diaporthaceae sp. PMI_573]
MAGNADLLPNYAPGTELMLVVDEANEPFPRELHITIAREITTTMSPVLEVTYTDDSGAATKRAVLKLFDRRLGSSLRKVDTMKDPPEREYLPATPETEKAYRSYVQSGKASELWDEIKADMEELVTLGYPEQYYEPTEEGLVRYEGALQHTIQYYFRDEIAAYDKLAHMQGDCIPRMLAHVHLPLTPSSETDDTKDDDSPFLRVNGVLLEYVSGTPLSDFEDCCPPIETQKWSSILQDVVNTAEKINRAGVLMKDCRSGNVLLRTETWQPVFVDFAHSSVGDFDDEEAEFGASVCYRGNPVCVVRSLVSLGHSRGGVKFNLTYPDYHDLVRKDDSDSREDDCDFGEVDSDSSTRLPRHRSREN